MGFFVVVVFLKGEEKKRGQRSSAVYIGQREGRIKTLSAVWRLEMEPVWSRR